VDIDEKVFKVKDQDHSRVKCTFSSLTYGRPSVVCVAEAYRSMVLRLTC